MSQTPPDVELSPVQEDYLESIYQLSAQNDTGVRITDLAERFGCRLPTVTRTVQRLKQMGLVRHPDRGLVLLSDQGIQLASELAHRHRDVREFLTRILGLSPGIAERDSCRLEHGLSAAASQRLHEFIRNFRELDRALQDKITDYTAPGATPEFENLAECRVPGWRG